VVWVVILCMCVYVVVVLLGVVGGMVFVVFGRYVCMCYGICCRVFVDIYEVNVDNL
jgi:hypothetical protein